MKRNNRNRNAHRTGWPQEERAGPRVAARAPWRLSFAEESADTESSCARKATWRFLLRDFPENRDDQDESYFVRLVWSPILSGMTNVTLSASESICPPCENGFDKSKTFKMEPGEVEFSWTSRCGRKFRVLAYSEPSPVFHQYDLQIDGESFVDFPLHRDPGDEHLRHLTRSDVSVAISPKRTRKGFGPFLFRRRAGSQDASPGTRPPSCADTRPPSSIDTAMHTPARSGCTSPCHVPQQPDPPSPVERPSKMLSSFDSSGLFQSVPSSFTGKREEDDCAGNCPRSVLSAFSDKETIASCFPLTDVLAIEANAISDACAFVDWNVDTGGIRAPDSSEVASFLQQQLNCIIRYVQCDVISSEAGARIFQNLQKITGFPTNYPVPRDTVVLVGIGATASQSDIWDAMIQFGPIESLSPTVGDRGIGICRFKSISSAELLVTTSHKGGVFVQGAKVLAMFIQCTVDYMSLQHDKDTESRTKESKGALTRTATQPPKNAPPATHETPFSSPLQKPFSFLRRMFKTPASSEESKRSACHNLLECGVPALPLLDHDADSRTEATSNEPEGSAAPQNQRPEAHKRAESADFPSLGVQPLEPLERSRSLFDQFRDAPLEEFRVLVKTLMKDSEGMLSLALTNALIESTPPTQKATLGNSIKHEAMLMQEVFTQIQSDKALYEREDPLQRVLNKAAIFVRNREISPEAASRIVSFSVEVLCHDCPLDAPAVAFAVVDAIPGTEGKDLLEAFGHLGEAQDATIVDEEGGFGLVLFESPLSCRAAFDVCENGVTVNGRHLRPVLIRSPSKATRDDFQEVAWGAQGLSSLSSPSLGGGDVADQAGGAQDGNSIRCLPESSGATSNKSTHSDGCGYNPNSDPGSPVKKHQIERSNSYPTSPRSVVSDPSSSSGHCGFEIYPPGGKDSVPCFISSKRLLHDMPSSE